MKWIGQHIYDKISRFRDDVYLEDISTGTIASGGNLGLDSNNKIVKATEASGDLTSIVAGTGLSGTSLTGPIPTLNVDAAQTQITSVGTLASLAVTSASDLGSAAMTLTNADVDQIALDINASNADANIIDVGATFLTSGNAIFIDSKNCRTEFYIDRDCNATGDQSHDGMIKLEGTKASITGSGDTHGMIGIKSTITDTATNVGTSNLINLDLSSNMTSDGGTTKLYGISNVITGASDDTIGFYSNVRNGNPDIKLVSSADATDYFTIATGSVGATTLTTVDTTVGATAHLDFAVDGQFSVASTGIDISGAGVISNATWQGTAIASAYLDSDTAHLSTQKHLTHHSFTADIDTTKTYIGMVDADSEATTTTGIDMPLVFPVASKLLQVTLRSNKNLSGLTYTWRLETQATGVGFATGPTIVGTQSGAGPAQVGHTVYDFTSSLDSGDNVIDAFDAAYLSLQSSGTTANTKYYITCVWELNVSSY